MVKQTLADGGTNIAAALTFYAVLSVFPALLVFVGLVALLGSPGTASTVLDVVARLGPPSAVQTFSGPVEAAIAHKGVATLSLGLGLVGTLWASSAFVGTFIWAADAIWRVPERRPFWHRLTLRLVTSVVIVALLAVAVVGIVATGPLAQIIGDTLGIGSTALLVYGVGKWVAFFVLAILVFDLLYSIAPDVRQPSFRWITPGGVLGVALFLIASAGFALYVAHFGSYDRLYGSLAGVIVFLMWAWLFNVGLILGAELDAELLRRRSGEPADELTAARERRRERAA